MMTSHPSPQDDFYYGLRRKVWSDIHGQPHYEESPLRPEDFLNPTVDDIFELGPNHAADVDRLKRVFENHYRHNQLTHVFANTKIIWPEPELDQPRADIIIATADSVQTLRNRLFDVTKWGAPPTSIIEVLSPRFLDADLVDKVDLYARSGVQEYFIIDSGLREEGRETNYSVIGYRLDGALYRRIEPDDSGFVRSDTNRVHMGPSKDGSTFDVIDSRTGTLIADHDLNQTDRIAEVQGNRRANDIGSALDFLRD